MNDSSRYRMTISLNVLNHLGLNLYSNTPTVLAEVIANSWDADARTVDVRFDIENKIIEIIDDGDGMNADDINDKYLCVGYQRRTRDGSRTSMRRKPMGRKGIGKLSLFAIADRFEVHSRKAGGEIESFVMDAEEIKDAIRSEEPSKTINYEPKKIRSDETVSKQGTIIRISGLKKARLTQASINGLRRRLARRFGIQVMKADGEFCIRINGDAITLDDRDYFHKARFLFQYGDYDYSRHCKNLDAETSGEGQIAIKRPAQFDRSGTAMTEGEHEIQGWIAIARRSNDLDGGSNDNLNKITIVVRGKVAQEDILQEYRLGGMITKYIYGEIYADFLDEDDHEDIATSSRQRIAEEDPRYLAVKKFIEAELKWIWSKTNDLKEKRGLEEALSSNPHVKQWYEKLTPASLKSKARKIFGAIDKAGVDEAYKQGFYADGILAFETLKLKSAVDQLDKISSSNEAELRMFLDYLKDIDAIEAARYSEIVHERLGVISRLREQVDDDAKERVLQDYIFNHLWLLDPAWERATQYAEMEKRIQEVVDGVGSGRQIRPDIQYRRVASAHVIVELKRSSSKLDKTEIEEQVKRYIRAVKSKLREMDELQNPVEAVCIVGSLPRGWEDLEERRNDEESLRPHSIRVITYEALINNAHSAYAKFIEASVQTSDIRELVERIRNFQPIIG